MGGLATVPNEARDQGGGLETIFLQARIPAGGQETIHLWVAVVSICSPGLGQKKNEEAHGKTVVVRRVALREAVAEGKATRRTTAGGPVMRTSAG